MEIDGDFMNVPICLCVSVPGLRDLFCINQINTAPHCFYRYYIFLNQQSITMIKRVKRQQDVLLLGRFASINLQFVEFFSASLIYSHFYSSNVDDYFVLNPTVSVFATCYPNILISFYRRILLVCLELSASRMADAERERTCPKT